MSDPSPKIESCQLKCECGHWLTRPDGAAGDHYDGVWCMACAEPDSGTNCERYKLYFPDEESR